MKQFSDFEAFISIQSHCVKSVQIRSLSSPHFSALGPNVRKYGTEKTPYLDTFHTVSCLKFTYKNNNFILLFIPQIFKKVDVSLIDSK